ncbi:unnamed protein product [Brachionus calyciflorus]|uniref:Uncharacterized protein n=1 Tax=Brachionus calyciflorus TaxID=104777 RepID=A0A813SEJ8_9BILA|nr:unnamed protein product [Brachionus calyciflorus]
MKLKVMNILSPVQLNNIQSRNWNIKSTSGQEKKEENMYKNPVRINNNNYHTMMTTTTANHYQKSQLNYQNDWSSS